MDSQSIAVNREWLDKLRADKAALEQRVGELEAALRPFAKEGDRLRKGPPGAWMNTFVDPGHWYAAAKALADGEGK